MKVTHGWWWAVVALGASGCMAEVGDLEGDEVGGTGEALTNISVCATGTTANAVGHISTDGASETYTYAGAWHHICSPPRDATIVDYQVNPWDADDTYCFLVEGDFFADNMTDCFATVAAMRIQKPNGSGGWTDVFVDSNHGSWSIGFPGHCNYPYVSHCRQNYDGSGTEATTFRVRGQARVEDGGDFETLYITGQND